MKRMTLMCVFAFGAAGNPSPGVARADADSIRIDYVLNPIVKTATKLDGAQRDLAASVSLLTERDLRLASTDAVLGVVQKRLPSLYVTEWGVMGFGVAGKAAGKISIRGAGGGANTHVLILRNGRPDFMGLMGCTIADEFSTDGVERIEVIRGPGSFLYGTNATGGIINIVSKRLTEEGFQTRLGGGMGAFGTRKASLNHGGKIGAFDYFVSANHRQTEGHRPGSAYEGNHATLHAGYRFGSSTVLEINANLADLMLRDPGTKDDPRADDWYDVFRWGGDATLVHEGARGETNLKLHGNFGKHRFFDGWRSHDGTLGVMAFHVLRPWPGNTMVVGLDVKRYGGDAGDASTEYGRFFVTETAPYFSIQQLLGGRIILSAGLRAEHHSLYGREILPRAGLVYHASAGTTLRASAAKGFRSPSIRELYFWMPANEALTPDRLWNYELGFEQRIGRRGEIEGAVFLAEGRNLIQFSGPPPRWINSGSYSHPGYEIAVRWVFPHGVEAGGSWSDIRLAEDAYHVPEKKLVLFANAETGRFTVSGRLIHVRGLTGADFSGPSPVPRLTPLEDYIRVDASVLFRPSASVEMRVALQNALNAAYQAMSGYPMPGRHLMLDIAYLWGRR